MKKTEKNREQQKGKRIIALLFIALTVCLMVYAFLLAGALEAFVGKAITNYELTDNSITVDLSGYKYAIVKGFITDKESSKIDAFSYGSESGTILYEEILKAEGASTEDDISFAKIVIVSNWYHAWLHEPIFVLGTLSLFIIPIPFCVAIDRKDKKRVENQKEGA